MVGFEWQSNANNPFLQFRCAGNGSGNVLMGELNNIDPFIRMASSSSVFRLQNSSSSDMMTLSNAGNMVVAGSVSSDS